MNQELLQFIDSMPWAKVSHAYGPANDAPHEIKRLMSDDVEDRMDAICGFLYSSAFHQYSIYTATPLVMRCVAKLLGLPKLPNEPSGMGQPMAYELLHFVRICAERGQTAMEGKPNADAPTIEEAASEVRCVLDGYLRHPEIKVREEALLLSEVLERMTISESHCAEPPTQKSSAPQFLARRICFCLAWICWIACLPMVLLAILFIVDPGPHGAFGALPIVFGFMTLVCGGLGWLLYFAGKSENRSSHTHER